MVALLIARVLLGLVIAFALYRLGLFRIIPKLIKEIKLVRKVTKQYKKDLNKKN